VKHYSSKTDLIVHTRMINYVSNRDEFHGDTLTHEEKISRQCMS